MHNIVTQKRKGLSFDFTIDGGYIEIKIKSVSVFTSKTISKKYYLTFQFKLDILSSKKSL